VCNSLQGDNLGAVAAFEKAISLQPDSADLRTLISEELSKTGQHEKAKMHKSLENWLHRFQDRRRKNLRVLSQP
jgi:hypothetical protein